MYSYEARKKAVEVLIESGMAYRQTIRELGYPKSRGSLYSWYKEFRDKGDLSKNVSRRPKYSTEEKQKAVNHYLRHGKNMSHTIRCLGYPCRHVLREWLKEIRPQERKITRAGGPRISYSLDQKSDRVLDMLHRERPVTEIQREYNVSRSSLYKWQSQVLAVEVLEKMRKKKNGKEDKDLSLEQLKEEHQKLAREYQMLQGEVKRLEVEKDILTEIVNIIKKEKGINLKISQLSNREKAIAINALREKHSLHILLRELKMAKSSYFYNLSAMNRKDKYSDIRLDIVEIFLNSFKTYGYRRVHAMLRKNGIFVSEKLVRRIMKEEGLTVIRKKKGKYNSYKGESMPSVANLLKRNFHADKPNQKWVTDITEFAIPAGKVYLSPIIDCYDGMPVSWTIGTNPTAELANTMLSNALDTLNDGEHPIIHSDRGSHYRWPDWVKITEDAGLVRSMSRKACPPDNAACEGFFGLIKNEMFYGRLWVNISREKFMKILDHYLHWFANERIKISLDGRSPVQYREVMCNAF